MVTRDQGARASMPEPEMRTTGLSGVLYSAKHEQSYQYLVKAGCKFSESGGGGESR